MTHVNCRLTVKNRDHLRNPALGNRLWATFTVFYSLCREYDDKEFAVKHQEATIQLTDDGPVYHALSVHLSQAKLITRFDDRYAYRGEIILSPEFRTKFQREVPLFLEITEFPFNTV